MNNTPLYYGMTQEEYISTISGDLENDSTSLAAIVLTGRDSFLLEGLNLLNFIKICLKKLLNAGAKPIDNRKDENGNWTSRISKKYGETDEEIIEAVIKEWQEENSKGQEAGDFHCWGVWFGLPKFITEK